MYYLLLASLTWQIVSRQESLANVFSKHYTKTYIQNMFCLRGCALFSEQSFDSRNMQSIFFCVRMFVYCFGKTEASLHKMQLRQNSTLKVIDFVYKYPQLYYTVVRNNKCPIGRTKNFRVCIRNCKLALRKSKNKKKLSLGVQLRFQLTRQTRC